MNAWVLLLASAVLTAAAYPVTKMLSGVMGLERTNFKGKRIASGFGLLLVIAVLPLCAMVLWLGGDSRVALFIAAIAGFGLLGLFDDIYGTRDVGGFRGHLSLLREGKVSTGFIKMLAGGVLALLLGLMVSGFRLFPGLINGLVIALTANMLNLLDLRPGRAVSCYWLGLLALVAAKVGRLELWQAVIPVLAPAALLTWLDRSAKVMLGDAGSNALGAMLGLAVVCEAGLAAKLIVLLFVASVHVYTEKRSISALIEGNRVLRRLDRALGER